MDNLPIQLGAQGNRAESPASVSPGSTASPENSPSFAAELGRALESELAPPQLHPSDEVGEAAEATETVEVAEATEESPLPDSEEPSEETSEKSSGVERVNESTRRHQSTLEGLLAKVPDSAKLALEHALEASAKGMEAAVAALGKTPVVEASALSDSEEPSEEISEKSSGVERVSESTRRHQSTLEGLLAKVPDSAKPALEHALEVSAKGTEAAVAALGKTPVAEGTESDGVPVEPESVDESKLVEAEPLVEKQAGAFSERGTRPPALRSFQDAIAEATSTSGTAAQDRDNSSMVSRKAVTDRDGEHPSAQAAPTQPLATRPRSVEARAFSLGIDSAQADASPVNKVQADELEAQTSGQDDDSAAANRSAKSEFDLSTLNPEDKGGVVVPFRVSISDPSPGPAGVSLAQHSVRPPTNTIANSESAPAPGAYKADLAAAAEIEHTRPGQIVSSARLLDQLKRVEMQIAFRTEVFGSVQLRTMIRNGQIGATIGVEKGEAQALLTSELPALERALAQRDLRVDNISIFQQSAAGDTGFSHGSEARSDTYPHRRQQAAAWSLEAEFEDSTELSVELYGAAGSPTRLSVRA